MSAKKLNEMMEEIDRLTQLEKEGKFIYLVYIKLNELDVSGNERGKKLEKLITQVNGLDVEKIERAIKDLQDKKTMITFRQKALMTTLSALPGLIFLGIALFKLGSAVGGKIQ